MNEFFKYLIPKLLEYFNNDKTLLIEFLPKIIDKGINNDQNLNVQENVKNA